jgi:CRP-like cAMP-binding protein
MDGKTKLWYFEEFKFLNAISREEINEINNSSFYRILAKNQIVYYPEDLANSIYFLKKGKVKISRYAEDGREMISALLHPGDVFGELVITSEGDERGEFAETTEDAVICVMNAAEIKDMIAKYPHFGMQIFKLVGLRLKKIQSRYESLCFRSAETRIKLFINEMVDEHGRNIAGSDSEKEINLNLTHHDISKLTATSRQTVTTVLNELEKQGTILYDRHRILVRDIKKLKY